MQMQSTWWTDSIYHNKRRLSCTQRQSSTLIIHNYHRRPPDYPLSQPISYKSNSRDVSREDVVTRIVQYLRARGGWRVLELGNPSSYPEGGVHLWYPFLTRWTDMRIERCFHYILLSLSALVIIYLKRYMMSIVVSAFLIDTLDYVHAFTL